MNRTEAMIYCEQEIRRSDRASEYWEPEQREEHMQDTKLMCKAILSMRGFYADDFAEIWDDALATVMTGGREPAGSEVPELRKLGEIVGGSER